MTRPAATHTGTCPGCHRRWKLTVDGALPVHRVAAPRGGPPPYAIERAVCVGSDARPKRGTRRPVT
jgi:hypothetical protein